MNYGYTWMLPLPSQWRANDSDRLPGDPTPKEIRQRIDEVWKLKAMNGGAFPFELTGRKRRVA